MANWRDYLIKKNPNIFPQEQQSYNINDLGQGSGSMSDNSRMVGFSQNQQPNPAMDLPPNQSYDTIKPNPIVGNEQSAMPQYSYEDPNPQSMNVVPPVSSQPVKSVGGEKSAHASLANPAERKTGLQPMADASNDSAKSIYENENPDFDKMTKGQIMNWYFTQGKKKDEEIAKAEEADAKRRMWSTMAGGVATAFQGSGKFDWDTLNKTIDAGSYKTKELKAQRAKIAEAPDKMKMMEGADLGAMSDSQKSAMAHAEARRLGIKVDPSATYNDLAPFLKAAQEREITKMTLDEKSKTAGKEKQLSAAEIDRLDKVNMGLRAIEDMSAALSEGHSTYSVFGDNPYTESARRFSEAIGRLESGGAIGEKEAKEFRAMAPTHFDSPEMKQHKLLKMKEEFNSRLSNLSGEKTFGAGERMKTVASKNKIERAKSDYNNPAATPEQKSRLAAFLKANGVQVK